MKQMVAIIAMIVVTTILHQLYNPWGHKITLSNPAKHSLIMKETKQMTPPKSQVTLGPSSLRRTAARSSSSKRAKSTASVEST